MNGADCLEHFKIVPERESRPFLVDALGAQIRIPCQPAEAVQIPVREFVAAPVLVETYIGDADERLHQRLDRGAGAAHTHVEIEDFFPHGNQKHGVPRLAEVLLCDLQLDCFLGFRECAEQRGCGLADLEVDGTVLHLDHDVRVELAVEIVEVVPGGAGAVVLEVPPIHVVIVDETAVEDETPMRRERPRHHVGGVGVSAAISGRADAPFRIGLHDESAQVRNGAVNFVDLRLPPFANARVGRIECVEAADCFRPMAAISRRCVRLLEGNPA